MRLTSISETSFIPTFCGKLGPELKAFIPFFLFLSFFLSPSPPLCFHREWFPREPSNNYARIFQLVLCFLLACTKHRYNRSASQWGRDRALSQGGAEKNGRVIWCPKWCAMELKVKCKGRPGIATPTLSVLFDIIKASRMESFKISMPQHLIKSQPTIESIPPNS